MKKIKVMGLLNLPANDEKLCDLLESGVIEIIGYAHNIQQAISIFKKKKPELVVMDIDWPTMPGMLLEMSVFFLDLNPSVKLVGICEKHDYENMLKIRNVSGKGLICYSKLEIIDPVERIIKVANGGWAFSSNKNP